MFAELVEGLPLTCGLLNTSLLNPRIVEYNFVKHKGCLIQGFLMARFVEGESCLILHSWTASSPPPRDTHPPSNIRPHTDTPPLTDSRHPFTYIHHFTHIHPSTQILEVISTYATLALNKTTLLEGSGCRALLFLIVPKKMYS